MQEKKLRAASGEFGSTNGQIKAITTEMTELVNSLKGTWTGEAADAFTSKFNQLSDDMEKIYRMVDEHVKDLQEMATQYEKAETENIETSNGLAGDVIS